MVQNVSENDLSFILNTSESRKPQLSEDSNAVMFLNSGNYAYRLKTSTPLTRTEDLSTHCINSPKLMKSRASL